MSSQIDSIFAGLNEYDHRIPLEILRNWLRNTNLSLQDVQKFSRFHPDHYVRNLMFSGRAFLALVLCWRNGQRSPIHDHKGSSCAVKVIRGIALETQFTVAANGMIFPSNTHELREGEITASQDADIHQMSNLQGNNAELVTLHIYSPPLHFMNTYSLTSSNVSLFQDPINQEFVAGAGI